MDPGGPFSIRGKTAGVTGGSRGAGKWIATRLAGRGGAGGGHGHRGGRAKPVG